MQTVKEFVDLENRKARIFNQNEIKITDVPTIVAIIESNLSPENLACDGERPVSEQNKLEIYYNRCLNELKQAGYKWNLNYDTGKYELA